MCVCVFEGYTKVGVGKDCQSHTLPIKQKASNYLRWLESSLHGQQNIFSYCMESYTYTCVYKARLFLHSLSQCLYTDWA